MTDQQELTQEEMQRLTDRCYEMLAKARLEVLRRAPYFGSLLYALVPVMAPGLGTIGVTSDLLLVVDPIRVVNDPELGALDSQGIPQKLAGALAHECMHPLRDMQRIHELMQIDRELANIAADLPINYDLREAKWELPSWGVFPEKYNFPVGLTMEEYFDLLRKDPEQAKATTRAIVAEAKGQDPGGTSPDVCAGQCGSVAGNPSPNEAAAAAGAGAPGRHQGEVTAAKKSSLQAAKQHFEKVNGCGNAPGWIEEQLGTLERRKDRDWVRELSILVRRRSGIIQAGGSDFSLRRPSKRSMDISPFIRPGMVEQQYEAAIYIDTSGSMGEEELQYAKNVVCNIMEQTGVDTVWLGQCDSKMHGAKRVRIREVPTMTMKGRGGTSFIPIFEHVRELKPKPDMVVVITDGDGPAPKVAPRGLCVIWVIVPCGYRRPAPWGHLIVASNDHALADPYYK
jgi:predicted metal-dependent peptidase